MKSFRAFAFVALALYFAIVLGINFHTHPAGTESSKLQCHLCQLSQMSVDIIGDWQPESQTYDFGAYRIDIVPQHADCFANPSVGRAPPLA